MATLHVDENTGRPFVEDSEGRGAFTDDLTTDQKLDVVLETLARVDQLLERFAPLLEQVEDRMAKPRMFGAVRR